MTTSTPPTAPAPKAAKPRAPRVPGAPPKTHVRSVSAGKDRLLFIAHGRKDGSWDSYVTHKEAGPDGKVAKTTVGAKAKYKDLPGAVAAGEAFVNQAKKDGWTVGSFGPRGGGASKPDAFSLSNLPKPKTVAK